jgi:DNA-binding MarR family transcriptional regulator
VRDTHDRRRVLVEATELARERTRAVYGPFTELIAPLFGHFTDEQITAVGNFLRITSEFYLAQIARVQTLARGNG